MSNVCLSAVSHAIAGGATRGFTTYVDLLRETGMCLRPELWFHRAPVLSAYLSGSTYTVIRTVMILYSKYCIVYLTLPITVLNIPNIPLNLIYHIPGICLVIVHISETGIGSSLCFVPWLALASGKASELTRMREKS